MEFITIFFEQKLIWIGLKLAVEGGPVLEKHIAMIFYIATNEI